MPSSDSTTLNCPVDNERMISLFLILSAFACVCGLGIIIVVCMLLLRPKPSTAGLAGPKEDEWNAAFRGKREHAFLDLVDRFGPTFALSGCVATCDPELVTRVLRSREHSVGRSWAYRALGTCLPSADGILFMGDEAWRVRHREFTPALAGRVVKRYSMAMFEAALSVASFHAGTHSARGRGDAVAAAAPPLGATSRPGADLLTALRWTATRVLLEFAAGVPQDSPDAVTLGRLFDAYTRTAFELIPAKAAAGGWAGIAGFIALYVKLFRYSWAIRRATRALVASGLPERYDGSNEARARGEMASSLSPSSSGRGSAAVNAAAGTDAAAAAAAAGTPLHSLLWHMLHPQLPSSTKHAASDPSSSTAAATGPSSFSASAIASEMNHLHGAHKAIALVSSLALFELSVPAHADVRSELIREFEGVCGRPPPGLSVSELLAYARAHACDEDAAAAGSSSSSSSANSSVNGGGPAFWRPPSRGDIEAGRLPVLSRVWRETLRHHVVSMGTLRRVGPGGLSFSDKLSSGSSIDSGSDSARTRGGAREGALTHRGSYSSSTAGTPAASTPPPGRFLPEGSTIVVLLHALHHNPRTWGPDAHLWRPDRWLERPSSVPSAATEEGGGGSSGSTETPAQPLLGPFFPFLDGVRRCAGMFMAELEFAVYLYVFLIIAEVRVSPPPPSATQPGQDQHPHSPPPSEKYVDGVLPGVDPLCTIEDVEWDRVCVIPAPASAAAAAPMAGSSDGSTVPSLWTVRKRADMFTGLDGRMPFTVTWH